MKTRWHQIGWSSLYIQGAALGVAAAFVTCMVIIMVIVEIVT